MLLSSSPRLTLGAGVGDSFAVILCHPRTRVQIPVRCAGDPCPRVFTTRCLASFALRYTLDYVQVKSVWDAIAEGTTEEA